MRIASFSQLTSAPIEKSDRAVRQNPLSNTLMLTGKFSCTGMKQHSATGSASSYSHPHRTPAVPQPHQLPAQTHFLQWFRLLHQTQRQGGCSAVQAHSLLASSARDAVAISGEDSSYCLKMSSQKSCPAELSRQCKVMTSRIGLKTESLFFNFSWKC